MNADRRKRITAIAGQLSVLHEELSALRQEEEDAKEAVPESLQSGERFEKRESDCDTLEECEDNLQSLIDSLNELE